MDKTRSKFSLLSATTATEYKKRNIPVDVLVIDYYHWPRCGDWRFDEEYFPNPKEMVKEQK